MNLLKINDILTKVMIGTFVSIIAFCFLTLALPLLVYAVVVLLYALALVTLLTFGTATYLFFQQINKMIDEFFKKYEQPH